VHLLGGPVGGARLLGQLVQKQVQQPRLVDPAQLAVELNFAVEVHDAARALTSALCGEEINGFGDGDGIDVFGAELHQSHHGDDLLLQVRVVELAGYHAAHGHLAGGRYGELQYQLAVQLGIIALRARVQAVQPTLVLVEDQRDLFGRTAGLAAAAAGGRRAVVYAAVHDARGDRGGGVTGEGAGPGAETAAAV